MSKREPTAEQLPRTAYRIDKANKADPMDLSTVKTYRTFVDRSAMWEWLNKQDNSWHPCVAV